MRKVIILTTCLIVFTAVANAQFLNNIGARQGAMGNSGVVISDIWASSHNQAGLAKIKNITGSAYISNAFGLQQLGLKAFAVALPTSKIGTFGINYSYYGYGQFNENKFAIAYAMQLGEKFSAGIQLDYFKINQGRDYGNIGAAVGEIGILATPMDNFEIAAHLFNISGTKLDVSQQEKIPSVLRIGVGYTFSHTVLLTVEAEKDLKLTPLYRTGLEYQLIENLFLRTGFSTQSKLSFQYSFGAGYSWRGITLDFAFVNHQILGYSTQFAISYTLGKKTAE